MSTNDDDENADGGNGDGQNDDGENGDGQENAEPEQDTSHLFRLEGLISNADLRVDVADRMSRFVAGDEDIEVDEDEITTEGNLAISRGARTRTAGSYERFTHHEELFAIGESVKETVNGGVVQMAKFAAESIMGGGYVNVIAGPYLRLAGWTDFLVWGGFAEADVVRSELSLLMIRSHVGYAHATGVRLTLASRMIDDFVARVETFGMLTETGATFTDAGSPGGGVDNEA